MADSCFIMQKNVDISLLTKGISIPAVIQSALYQRLGFTLKKGEARTVNILLNGQTYQVILKNQAFNEQKHPGHADILQIRYSPQSPIAQQLREIFTVSNTYIAERRPETPDKKQIIVPEALKETLVVYATPVSGTLMFDCIINSEYNAEASAIRQADELALETTWNTVDPNANIVIREGSYKVRQLSRAVGENLKRIYGYRCQICGQDISGPYGVHFIHAHHIDYFTRSLNNNYANIMILCPNHHGIIHITNAQFDRQRKAYHYPNGYVEGLSINYHL